jgi:outer membrane protein OmpA-like peptidoglycan-associated protein
MKIRSALAAASLLCLPVVAMAQPVDGLYVGAGLGYNYLQNQKVKSGAVGDLKANGGFIGLGSVGYGFGNGFRVEAEGNFRQSTHTSPGLPSSTKNQTYGGFVNGFYDFDVGTDVVYPYAGLGIGYEETREAGGLSGNKGSVAGQAILGASFPVPTVAGLSVTAEYRFMGTFDNETFGGVKVGEQYNHAGLLGLRYAFGQPAMVVAAAPPPPPAPAPAAAPIPAPARTYLVFFDWDKSDLSDRARQIIGEAAQNASKVKVTRIEVSGYADLTGTHAYNVALSQRRADSVAAELVSDGVPKDEIVTQAFGDTNPLVPTAEGVREPQNRRVEIVLK